MCRALGLDPDTVYRLTIKYVAGKSATAEALLFVRDKSGEVIELLKRFREVPDESGEIADLELIDAKDMVRVITIPVEHQS